MNPKEPRCEEAIMPIIGTISHEKNKKAQIFSFFSACLWIRRSRGNDWGRNELGVIGRKSLSVRFEVVWNLDWMNCQRIEGKRCKSRIFDCFWLKNSFGHEGGVRGTRRRWLEGKRGLGVIGERFLDNVYINGNWRRSFDVAVAHASSGELMPKGDEAEEWRSVVSCLTNGG